MLNARLYRRTWLVAAVGLVVAPLTLQSPPTLTQPNVPTQFDGRGAAQDALALERLAPDRTPGSSGDRRVTAWVRDQLGRVTSGRPAGGASGVKVERFVARTDHGPVSLDDIYVVDRGTSNVKGRPAILVVAPRDEPAGVRGGTSATALLVELAKHATTGSHDRPIYFVSTSGGSLGNAGVRWFLSRFSQTPIVAAVVLDGPGDAPGTGVDLWATGSNSTAANGLRDIAAQAAGSDARVAGGPSLVTELMRFAVPQAVGAQGAIVAAGIPAVTISARPEGPLPADTPAPTADRMAVAGNVAQAVIATIDQSTAVPRPSSAIPMAGRRMRPLVVRLCLLLALLPLLAVAVDLAARLRRARVFTGRGFRALRWRFVAPLGALGAAHLMVPAHLFPAGAAGKPPVAADVAFGGLAAFGVLLTVAVWVALWRWARVRVARARALPPIDSAAALLGLAAALVVIWWVQPFALVLALPAAHAAVVATMIRERWQAVGLGAIAVAPLLVLAAVIGGLIDRGVPFTLWYLAETTVAGTRGWLGIVLGIAVGVCAWTLAAPAVRRSRRPSTRPTRVLPTGTRDRAERAPSRPV